MIKISKRLEAISSLVPVNSKVIDIGCDHGLLDIYLYQQKISKKIIASDINNNALSNAKENIKKYNLEKIIETRLGNGLDTLNENDTIDTMIISGMGANTIIEIIKNNLVKIEQIDNFIIQSNTKIPLLRKELNKLKFKIIDEIYVEDNKKSYIIIKFVKGREKYNKKELYFGPILLKKNEFEYQQKLKSDLNKLKFLLTKLPKNKFIERYKIKKEINLYKKVI